MFSVNANLNELSDYINPKITELQTNFITLCRPTRY